MPILSASQRQSACSINSPDCCTSHWAACKQKRQWPLTISYNYNYRQNTQLRSQVLHFLPSLQEKKGERAWDQSSKTFSLCWLTKKWSTEPVYATNNAINQLQLKGTGWAREIRHRFAWWYTKPPWLLWLVYIPLSKGFSTNQYPQKQKKTFKSSFALYRANQSTTENHSQSFWTLQTWFRRKTFW